MLVWGNNKNLNKSSKNNRNKSPQLGLKYLNDIIKKIQISNYKTYHVTPHQSKKNSNDKKKVQKKYIPLSSKSKSNSKSKSTSITKINNIIIPTMMNNYKKILSKYSAVSHLTSHTINNISHNIHNDKKQINLSSISKYNYYKNNTIQNKNKKKNKKENDMILKIKS